MKSEVDKYKEWAFAAIICLLVIPFLYISQYNHPSADDYCIAMNAKEEGLWLGQKVLYINWSGRFFSTFVTSIGPLYFNSFYLVKVLPVAILFTFFLGFFKSIELVFQKTLSLSQLTTISLSSTFLFVLNVNNLPEGLYSYTASLPYVMPVIGLFFLMNLTLKINSKSTITTLNTISILLLVLIIVGSNETAALMLNLLVPYFFILTKENNAAKKTLAIIWGLTIVLSVFVFIAPGFIESAANPKISNTDFNELITEGFQMTTSNLNTWLFKTPVLFFSFLLILFLKNKPTQISWLKSIHPIVHVLYIAIALVALHIFSFYTIDYDHPTRLSVMLFGVFLVSWFWIICSFSAYYSTRTNPIFYFLNQNLFQQVPSTKLYGANFVAIGIFVLLSNNNLRTVATEIALGHLEMYDRENEIRYKMIGELENNELIQFTIRPESLYLEDITTEENAWQNRCYSTFYNLPGVSLSK